MNFAKTERAALCDLLDRVGPDSPTLCAGWTTHDLAAHLWIRETDPLGVPGIVAKPLAGLTERRMRETKTRWDYTELVDRVRRGPARMSVFAFPGVDEEANTVEFFVHHEDVRRAPSDFGHQPEPARELSDEVEDWMWRRMKLMGRALFRKASVGVVLERKRAEGAVGEPETIRVLPGAQTVTVVGQPSELMLLAYGRGVVADLDYVGEDADVAAFKGSDFSL